jgi:hypothetical protein
MGENGKMGTENGDGFGTENVENGRKCNATETCAGHFATSSFFSLL